MHSGFLLSRAAGALAIVCGASAAHAQVNVTLSPAQPGVGRGDDVLVIVTLTNTSNTVQQLLRWRTPQQVLEAPLFEVQRDGQPVRYLGRRIKRAAPGPADYLQLAPGEVLSQTVELSRFYEMRMTGNYTIRYRSPAMPAPGATTGAVVGELTSNPVTIRIDGSSTPTLQDATAPGPGFANCTNAQQTQLTTALAAGRAMAADSQAYLTSGTPYGARYAMWFGAQDAARGAKVTANVTAIREAFENKPIKIDCDCDEPYFAYVYPARPYTVWVCKAFWAAAPTGTDSRGGTLMHELSHFNVVAATDDHVYGQAAAADMARSAPQRAINNADSYEYFGENTPRQATAAQAAGE
ncbi:peptidase M35 [Oxalobacteraceae sp. CFBP 8763]|nr:peptidase M35 [Oxalobacteraceae sp. CFBP 8763]